MKKKSKVLILVGVIIIVIIFGVVKFISLMEETTKQFDDVEIHNVNLAKIENGEYTGSFRTTAVSVEVKVIVKDHKINNIEILKHDNGQGAKAEAITDKVISEQSLEVDFVSGATYSSKAILKAIENALDN
jgi:uncharacterized protein with FMN-binding domain